MTEEEVLKEYEAMADYFGDALPNFEHHPRQFAYYVKLWRYYKSRNNVEQNNELGL